MRYFFDTEFIEDGKTIDLISIGIVSEDGREYYAVNSQCDFSMASNWVWENVLYPIGIYQPIKYVNLSDPSVSSLTRSTICNAKPLDSIKAELLDFFSGDSEIQLWGDYAAHDFVLFGQLMSRGDRNKYNPMSDCYPSFLPWHYFELRQEAYRVGADLSVVLQENEHHALEDARWVKKAWLWLNSKA